MADTKTGRDDHVQHGIDDSDTGDAGKGALLGGIGGAVVGALAGGPIGAAVGAVTGALASGAAVAAVDAVDNDATVSGVGDGTHVEGDATRRTNSTNNTTRVSDANLHIPPANFAKGSAMETNRTDILNSTNIPDTDGRTGSAIAGSIGDTYTDTTAHGGTLDELTDRDVLRVPVVEEELHVDKQAREAGQVQVSKHVVEEQVNVPVTLQREEVVVSRHPVDRAASTTDLTDDVLQDGDTIRVPVREEVAVVTKEAHVKEEIEIAKTRASEQQTVGDTIRREEVDVDTTGRVQVDDANRFKR